MALRRIAVEARYAPDPTRPVTVIHIGDVGDRTGVPVRARGVRYGRPARTAQPPPAPARGPVLTALLHEASNEILGVGLEHVVDLVEDVVHVVAQLLLPFLEVLGCLRVLRLLLDLLRGARRLLLSAAGVLGRHV